jgi:hypothetical protein
MTMQDRIHLWTLFVAAFPASAQQIKNAVPYVAQPLPLSAVRIMGGPLKRAQDLDAEPGSSFSRY